MWELVLDDLKSQNVCKFILWSDPFAEEFYKRMGCNKIGTKKSQMMPNRYPTILEYTLDQ